MHLLTLSITPPNTFLFQSPSHKQQQKQSAFQYVNLRAEGRSKEHKTILGPMESSSNFWVNGSKENCKPKGVHGGIF